MIATFSDSILFEKPRGYQEDEEPLLSARLSIKHPNTEAIQKGRVTCDWLLSVSQA